MKGRPTEGRGAGVALTAPSSRTRLIALGALIMLVSAMAAVCSVEARASHTYFASFPPGECDGNTITVFAPTSVSPWAGDTKIAWQAHLWVYTSAGWQKDIPSGIKYADVSYGSVYAPYGDGVSFTITRPGYYGVTVSVYSYGLRQWRSFTLMLRFSDAFAQQFETGWCGFGV